MGSREQIVGLDLGIELVHFDDQHKIRFRVFEPSKLPPPRPDGAGRNTRGHADRHRQFIVDRQQVKFTKMRGASAPTIPSWLKAGLGFGFEGISSPKSREVIWSGRVCAAKVNAESQSRPPLAITRSGRSARYQMLAAKPRPQIHPMLGLPSG